MRTRRGVRSIIAVAIALTGLAAFSGTAGAEAPAPNERQARFEIDFMMDTIDHHFMGVQMGEMCVEKTTAPPPVSDDTLRATCAEIVAAQSQQIEQLQGWLQDWYGITKEPTMPPNGDRMMEMLAEADGEEFDIEVSEMFIKHHQSFLPEAAKCIRTAYHPELRELCEEMYAAQSQEIEVFKGILNDHGVNRQGPNGQPGGRR